MTKRRVIACILTFYRICLLIEDSRHIRYLVDSQVIACYTAVQWMVMPLRSIPRNQVI